MKRALSLLFLIIVLFLIIQWGGTFFKKEHEINYQINSNKTVFKVAEKYQKSLKSYDIEITSDNYSFIYTIKDTINKQKKIIKNLEVFQEGTMMCIYPVLIKEGVETNIECNIDGNLKSYESIKDNQMVKSFVSSLKEKGYHQIAWVEESNTTTNADSSLIYTENLLPNDYITIWTYKGIEVINKKSNNYHFLYSFDKYENNHGVLVDQYYLSPVYASNRVFDFNQLKIIDITNGETKTMELAETLNQDTYINGVVDHKAYYFDPDHLLQIEVNPSKKTERQIGSKEINGQYYDGTWTTQNIYDFVGNKKKFQIDYSKNSKLMSYQPIQVLESSTNYYYSTADGSLYQLSKNNLDLPMLLFKKTGIKDLKLKDNTLYFMIEDALYYYQENTGIRKIIKNQEWNYHSSNIIDIYKKPE